VEEDLRARLEREGWQVMHTGWPDFLCVKGNQTIFVEAKTDNGRLSKEQAFVLDHLRKLGLRCYKWTPSNRLEPIGKLLLRKHRGNSLSSYIRNWVDNANGQFHTSELDTDLGITSRQGKSLRRGVLKILCDQGKLKRIHELVGTYRVISKGIDWQS